MEERRFWISLVIFLSVDLTAGYVTSPFMSRLERDEESMNYPIFDNSTPTFVESPAGQTVYLACSVYNLGTRVVSWIRKKDLHILSTGIFTYTNDKRFHVFHPVNTNSWNLQIKYPKPNDSGIYECQVSTEPKVSRGINLTVLGSKKFVSEIDKYDIPHEVSGKQRRAQIWGSPREPIAKIPDAKEIHIREGNDLTISCVVDHILKPTTTILWQREKTVLDITSARGGISIHTETRDRAAVSRLALLNLTLLDAGNYFCHPTDGRPASVTVHVIQNEQAAAMQFETDASVRFCHSILCPMLSLLSITIFRPG